jgi:oligopeptide/dipeptide ABC transporter ATP-binding protein
MDEITNTPDNSTVLSVRDLAVHFKLRYGTVRALEGASFSVKKGRTLGVIGESGSGKSIAARAILQLLPRGADIVAGKILFSPVHGAAVNITNLDPTGTQMRSLRGGEIAMIFQEPMSSLTPVYTAGVHIGEGVGVHGRRQKGSEVQSPSSRVRLSKKETRDLAVEMLARVGLPNPKARIDSYPHQLSGGQRQRVMIAIALACQPSLLIADEPTTALDVTTQAQINDLMRDVQAEFGMGMVYITHDMGVIGEMADEVAVMYLGTVVESGPVDDIFYKPGHPYTRALLKSMPRLGGQRGKPLETIKGVVPSPFSIPQGCPFHDRCSEVISGLCDVKQPPLVQLGPNHSSRCWLNSESEGEGKQ